MAGVVGLTKKPKLLVFGASRDGQPLPPVDADSYEVITESDPVRALARLSREPFAGVFVAPSALEQAIRHGEFVRNACVLEGMPDGVVLLDTNNTIVWANRKVCDWTHSKDVVGANFYTALGNPEILGPDFCPFHTALATSRPSSSTLRAADNRYFQVHAAPESKPSSPQHLIVSIRDVTDEWSQRQKLDAIHKAGASIADMSPDEIGRMSVEDRIDLVKSNILHYTKDLLQFDVIEIRMLDEETGELKPLLSIGMDAEAAKRPLFARRDRNGVTGFVASTGKSYLCEDTTEDPLYLQGFMGAKSSLTVPLLWHDSVIGTFNVESPKPRAFTESDLRSLETFACDVARSLNTLQLLVAQQINAAQVSVEAIHRAVALPVDEILNDAVNVLELYTGLDAKMVERLKRILRNARDIKQMIQEVGQRMAPSQAVPSAQADDRPRLRDRRVLVVDNDDAVRNDAHSLLERYGCIVETAHTGGEAVFMVRNSEAYDVIIADIRLPDMNGYALLMKLRETLQSVPLVLMTAFGYDGDHSILNARRAGLHPKAILYKPFRLAQLLETVERIPEEYGTARPVQVAEL